MKFELIHVYDKLYKKGGTKINTIRLQCNCGCGKYLWRYKSNVDNLDNIYAQGHKNQSHNLTRINTNYNIVKIRVECDMGCGRYIWRHKTDLKRTVLTKCRRCWKAKEWFFCDYCGAFKVIPRSQYTDSKGFHFCNRGHYDLWLKTHNHNGSLREIKDPLEYTFIVNDKWVGFLENKRYREKVK